MEIKIEKKADVAASLSDGLRIEAKADLDTEQIVGPVRLVVSPDGDAFEFEPEELERAGRMVEALRRKVGDLRDLCIEHGYYESKRPHYDCPICGKNTEAAPAAAPALVRDFPDVGSIEPF